MSERFEIVVIERSDLVDVAAIHCAAYRESVLTRLGEQAVRRYYEWQLTGPHQVVALIAQKDHARVGFIFGGVFRGAMSGFLRRNSWYLAWRLLSRPWSFTDALAWNRIGRALKILTRPHKARSPSVQVGVSWIKPPFDVLSIAVDPKCQGRGVASQLMVAVEERARQSGCREMHLTVAPLNDRAIALYERLGWEKVLQNGAWVGGMRKVVPVDGQSPNSLSRK